MIRINLLPDEFRRSERTSPKLFAATICSVIMVCSAFGWFSYVYFGELGELKLEHEQVAEILISKEERASYYDLLVKEEKAYNLRSQTIQTIGSSRRLWTKFLDQFVDVVNNEGNTARHLAWFQSISVSDGNSKRGPSVTMPGFVQGNAIQKVADFHDDLEDAPFYMDIAAKTPPGGEKKVNPKRNPPEAFSFGLKLDFKPAQDWAKNAKTPRGK